MGKFVIKRRSDDQYMFTLMSGANVLLTSEGYVSKHGCLNGINSVKVNSRDDRNYSRKIAVNKQWYFVLTASNGEPIAVSETYDSEFSMELGITAVKKVTPDGDIDDRTN
jgi:uncharacterized protein